MIDVNIDIILINIITVMVVESEEEEEKVRLLTESASATPVRVIDILILIVIVIDIVIFVIVIVVVIIIVIFVIVVVIFVIIVIIITMIQVRRGSAAVVRPSEESATSSNLPRAGWQVNILNIRVKMETKFHPQGGASAPFLQLRPAEKTFLAMSGVLTNVRNSGPARPSCDNLAQVSFCNINETVLMKIEEIDCQGA